MRNFGLIGKTLKHSFSPEYFRELFEQKGLTQYSYKACELHSIEAVVKLVDDEKLAGFNVTIPYKQEIIPYLHGISTEAAAINAVNLVKIVDGRWMGFNTDLPAFTDCLIPHLPRGNKALIFGSGGSSRTVSYCLQEWGIQTQIVSRGGSFRYEDLNEDIIADHKLLINTSPVGMFPDVDERLNIPMMAIGPGHYCFDLIYNPAKTVFLREAEERGAEIQNGLQMLRNQAVRSFEIWEAHWV